MDAEGERERTGDSNRTDRDEIDGASAEQFIRKRVGANEIRRWGCGGVGFGWLVIARRLKRAPPARKERRAQKG